VITASSVTLTSFEYDGNVNLPVAGGGTETVMEFSMSSMSLTGVTVKITENGSTLTTTTPTYTFSGNVTLYATKLSGTLFGIPITLTPATVAGLLLVGFVFPLPLVMTSITTDQFAVIAGTQQTGAEVMTLS
jgi:hypothetical protein